MKKHLKKLAIFIAVTMLFTSTVYAYQVVDDSTSDFEEGQMDGTTISGTALTLEYESGDKPPTSTAELPIDCEIIDVGEDYHIVRCQIRGTETKFDYTMKNKTN